MDNGVLAPKISGRVGGRKNGRLAASPILGRFQEASLYEWARELDLRLRAVDFAANVALTRNGLAVSEARRRALAAWI